MATGDVVVFEEAKAKMIAGDWATTDDFYLAIVDATVTPTADFATPTWSDFSANEVTGAAGGYVVNGTDLGALSALVSEAAGTMTFDSATDPTWALKAGHSTDATWGIIYNFTDATQDALAYVELGTVDMTAGVLTVTWNASGIFTIT